MESDELMKRLTGLVFAFGSLVTKHTYTDEDVLGSMSFVKDDVEKIPIL